MWPNTERSEVRCESRRLHCHVYWGPPVPLDCRFRLYARKYQILLSGLHLLLELCDCPTAYLISPLERSPT